MGIFHEINHPAIGVSRIPHLWKPPYLLPCIVFDGIFDHVLAFPFPGNLETSRVPIMFTEPMERDNRQKYTKLLIQRDINGDNIAWKEWNQLSSTESHSNCDRSNESDTVALEKNAEWIIPNPRSQVNQNAQEMTYSNSKTKRLHRLENDRGRPNQQRKTHLNNSIEPASYNGF